MDIYWRDSYTCPSEDEYHEMVKKSKLQFKLKLVSYFYVALLRPIFSPLCLCLCTLGLQSYKLYLTVNIRE